MFIFCVSNSRTSLQLLLLFPLNKNVFNTYLQKFYEYFLNIFFAEIIEKSYSDPQGCRRGSTHSLIGTYLRFHVLTYGYKLLNRKTIYHQRVSHA